MAHNSHSPAPLPTLRRLPLYYRLLESLKGEGVMSVSCTRIADELAVDPTGVRKDLAFTGIIGKPRVGYDLIELMNAIAEFLGWSKTKEAFLIGAGDLGRALMGYGGFRERGLNIVAAFDTDPTIIGHKIHGKEVLNVEKLGDLITRMKIHIGIIVTPAKAAQSVADVMVNSGIEAIWNFAPARLEAPETVIVENVELSASLSVLSSKLTEARKAAESLPTEQ